MHTLLVATWFAFLVTVAGTMVIALKRKDFEAVGIIAVTTVAVLVMVAMYAAKGA